MAGGALAVAATSAPTPPGRLLSRLRSSSTSVDTDNELRRLLDVGTAELLGEHLRRAPRMVRAWTGSRLLRGAFLRIETDDVRLRIHLYRRATSPWIGDTTHRLACLTQLVAVDGQGWLAVFDGPTESRRYLGWLVERLPTGPPVATATAR